MDNLDKTFITFVNHVNEVHDFTFLKDIINEPSDKKIERIKRFNDSIKNNTHINFLCKHKIKLFSHKEKDTAKISESLFGSELSLKKIFNNQEETIKLVLWDDLKKLLITYNEYLLTCDDIDDKKDQINDRIEKLKINNKNFDPKESIDKILNTKNLNETTNNMISDIFNSFQKTFDDSNSGNPFNNILEISQKITEKYKDKIDNGEVKLDDLLSNMTNLPGMENMGNMVNMLSSNLNGANKDEEKVIIDENFSTATIEQGTIKEDSGMGNLNVGSILKTMDNFKNMVPNLQNDDNTNPENDNNPKLNNNIPNGMPDLQKMMGLFNKLGSANNADNLNNIFEKELGIDINKFSKEITKILEK
jgi:hypothetical protein